MEPIQHRTTQNVTYIQAGMMGDLEGEQHDLKYDILTVGFPMVEIMRKERNVPFDVPADFTGPYPSADYKVYKVYT